jgi:site-specific recombinase XerD
VSAPKGHVFRKPNGYPFTADYVSKKFKQICREAQIDGSIHFHSLRHSFASALVKSGVSIYTVKELMGHSSVSVTEIYSHLQVEDLKQAVNIFNRKVVEENNEQNN